MSVTSWFDDQARTLVAGLTDPAGQAETRLVVGPAGSGRSRVLHAAAGHLRAAGITVGTRWANPGPEGCALLVDDLDRLAAIVGRRHLLTSQESMRRYQTGFRFGSGRALAVVGGTQGVMQVALTAPQNQIRTFSHDQDHHDHQQ